MKLRKGDQVIVIAGNDKGKIGAVISGKGKRILVEGVHVRKKHMKKTQEQKQGQIVEIETTIDRSNVRPCVGDKPVKLRVRKNKEGERELYYLQDKKEVLYRPVKAPAK